VQCRVDTHLLGFSRAANPECLLDHQRNDERDGVTGVMLDSGNVVDADLVIAANGWSSAKLLADIGISLPIEAYRSELLVVDAGVRLPDLSVISDLISLQYCRVDGSGQFLVGNSDHADFQKKFVDPENYSNVATEASVLAFGEKVMHRFPGFPEPAVTHT
jgi:glycine/D-amino acid oxidase-like deaminating enzyme